jgi:hypothetical protein
MGATTTDRPKTYAALIRDDTVWTVADIARELDVELQTVRTWRKDSRAVKRASSAATAPSAAPSRSLRRAAGHPNRLPDPDFPVENKPMWKAGTIRKWAIQTGRMEKDGTPKRLKPPGRPRAKRAA